MLEKVYAFPEVVENAALKELPHLVTNYVYELANLFIHIILKIEYLLIMNKKLWKTSC